jgi:hypothetical protein
VRARASATIAADGLVESHRSHADVRHRRPRPSSRARPGAYEKGSIVLTTNRGIADWSEIFEDTVVASAILDRLLHHATVIATNGDCYRMRRHHDHVNTIRPALTGSD